MHTHSGVVAVDLGHLQLIDFSNARHVGAPVTLNAYANNACFQKEGWALGCLILTESVPVQGGGEATCEAVQW